MKIGEKQTFINMDKTFRLEPNMPFLIRNGCLIGIKIRVSRLDLSRTYQAHQNTLYRDLKLLTSSAVQPPFDDLLVGPLLLETTL